MSLIFHGFVSMLELMCPLSPAIIDSSYMVKPLLELLDTLPGFSPSRYDINQHESWRSFDLEKTHVDALSQRVQLLRVQGADPSHLAMLSLGKRGEIPTLVVRTPDAPIAALLGALTPLVDAIPMRWLTITSEPWRQAVSQASPKPSLSPIMVWPHDSEPSQARLGSHPDFARHPGTQTITWTLSTHTHAPDATHLAALHALMD